VSDLGSSNYSETAASNNAAPPNGWPAGMNPSQVEPSARENMAATKRFWNRNNSVKTTGGTSTAYALTYDVAAASYYDGEEHSLVINATCGATPSLNINGLGAQLIRKFSGGAYVNLASGDVVTSQPIRVRTNVSATTFDIVSGAADIGAFVPTGVVVPYAGTSAPAGYLLCFGQAISRTTFAALFAVCSTTYGAGDGSTTFNVPDLRGIVVAGKDDMGGSAAGRLTATTMSPNATTLGAVGGSQTVTTGGPNDQQSANLTSPTGNVASINHGHAGVPVVQPTIILNYIIKT
jgi:microcystin-dependent protein